MNCTPKAIHKTFGVQFNFDTTTFCSEVVKCEAFANGRGVLVYAAGARSQSNQATHCKILARRNFAYKYF